MLQAEQKKTKGLSKTKTRQTFIIIVAAKKWIGKIYGNLKMNSIGMIRYKTHDIKYTIYNTQFTT